MGVAGAARALIRVHYRIARAPAQVLDEAVLPIFFAADAPARSACEHLSVSCDRAAARLLGDTAAATRADRLRRRSAAIRYAIARRHRQFIVTTDAVLARHRARFEQRRRSATPTAR